MHAGTPYRPEIDGLRAIAVGGVVIFHAAPQALPGGFAGVDVFFVISGFLIGSIIAKDVKHGNFSFLAFYQRRIRRLLPAMTVVLLATVIAGAVMLVPSEFSTLTFTLRASILYASNIVFAMRTGYFDQAGAASPLLHTWSLSIEEQFYLLCPLLVWSIHRIRPAAILPTLCALALLSCAMGIHGAWAYPQKAFFLPHTRMWELLIGVILAQRGVLPGSGEKLRECIGWLGLSAILFAFLTHSGEHTPYPGFHALIPCLGTAMIIEANRASLTGSGKFLCLRPFVYIGLISYPLYLWHWPILIYLRMLGPEWSAVAPSLVAMLVAFILADLTRRYVEQPYRNSRAGNWKRDYGFLAFVSVGFVGLSLISEITKGLPQRFSRELRATFQTSDEWRDSQRLACMRNGAIMGLEPRQAPGHPCRIGTPDAPVDVILWGDSHAAALQPGLDAALKAAGRGGVVISGGCLPIAVAAPKTGISSKACDEHQAQILRDLAQGRAKTLVIAQRWTALIDSVMPIEREFRRLNPSETENRARELTSALRAFAAAFANDTRQMIVVGTVPEIEFNVPNMIGFRLNIGLTPPKGPDLAQVRARQRPSILAIEAALLGGSARLLDPVPFFCTAGCAVADQIGPLYFDNNHLTSAATWRIEAMFKAVLR